MSDCLQRLFEVGDQIVRILDPDTDPYQIIGNSEFRAPSFRDRKVSHRSRVTCQSFCSAKADGELGDFQAVEKAEALGLSAF